MALQMQNPFSPGQSVGTAIGFDIIIHQADDETFPDKFSKLMIQARNDGSARRIEYKVSRQYHNLRNPLFDADLDSKVSGRLKRLLDGEDMCGTGKICMVITSGKPLFSLNPMR